MINLLPLEEEKKLILENRKKLVLILGNIVVISLLSLFLILFSLKLYIWGEIISQKIILNNFEKKYQTKDFLVFKQIIEKYNTVLVKVDNFYKKEVYFNDSLRYILNVKIPTGLFLTNINMDRTKDDNIIKISVLGTSDTRDNLLIFKNNIENNLTTESREFSGKIENIIFPPNNWIKSKNINFNFTADYKK